MNVCYARDAARLVKRGAVNGSDCIIYYLRTSKLGASIVHTQFGVRVTCLSGMEAVPYRVTSPGMVRLAHLQ